MARSWAPPAATSCAATTSSSGSISAASSEPNDSTENTMTAKLFPTTVVGSYPQPDWLVDRKMLSKVVPRVRMKEMWRVADEFLEQAQDDATIIAIRDMERAGIDIITDGEMRRESYSNRFATALEGVDIDKPATVKTRAGAATEVMVPRVVGKVRRRTPVEL